MLPEKLVKDTATSLKIIHESIHYLHWAIDKVSYRTRHKQEHSQWTDCEDQLTITGSAVSTSTDTEDDYITNQLNKLLPENLLRALLGYHIRTSHEDYAIIHDKPPSSIDTNTSSTFAPLLSSSQEEQQKILDSDIEHEVDTIINNQLINLELILKDRPELTGNIASGILDIIRRKKGVPVTEPQKTLENIIPSVIINTSQGQASMVPITTTSLPMMLAQKADDFKKSLVRSINSKRKPSEIESQEEREKREENEKKQEEAIKKEKTEKDLREEKIKTELAESENRIRDMRSKATGSNSTLNFSPPKNSTTKKFRFAQSKSAVGDNPTKKKTLAANVLQERLSKNDKRVSSTTKALSPKKDKQEEQNLLKAPISEPLTPVKKETQETSPLPSFPPLTSTSERMRGASSFTTPSSIQQPSTLPEEAGVIAYGKQLTPKFKLEEKVKQVSSFIVKTGDEKKDKKNEQEGDGKKEKEKEKTTPKKQNIPVDINESPFKFNNPLSPPPGGTGNGQMNTNTGNIGQTSASNGARNSNQVPSGTKGNNNSTNVNRMAFGATNETPSNIGTNLSPSNAIPSSPYFNNATSATSALQISPNQQNPIHGHSYTFKAWRRKQEMPKKEEQEQNNPPEFKF